MRMLAVNAFSVGIYFTHPSSGQETYNNTHMESIITYVFIYGNHFNQILWPIDPYNDSHRTFKPRA